MTPVLGHLAVIVPALCLIGWLLFLIVRNLQTAGLL